MNLFYQSKAVAIFVTNIIHSKLQNFLMSIASGPGWNKYNNQTYSRPWGWRLDQHHRGPIKGLPETPRTPRNFSGLTKGPSNWASITQRSTSLSDSSGIFSRPASRKDVCTCVCLCVRVRVYICVCVCVRVCQHFLWRPTAVYSRRRTRLPTHRDIFSNSHSI